MFNVHDTSQRDTNLDTDGDGWTDVKELEACNNFLLSSDVPLDTDGIGCAMMLIWTTTTMV